MPSNSSKSTLDNATIGRFFIQTTTVLNRAVVCSARWLVVRAGSYYEPTRFREPAGPRIHGTGGFDVHIPIVWSLFGLLDDDTSFRVGGAVDGAARYFGWAVSAGIWR